jgi:hypothetical protein
LKKVPKIARLNCYSATFFLENKGEDEDMKLGIGGPLPDFISQ